MSQSMNFPISNSISINNELSKDYTFRKNDKKNYDNIYAQYKPALSRENSNSINYMPSNLTLVVEPKKMEFDILMRYIIYNI